MILSPIHREQKEFDPSPQITRAVLIEGNCTSQDRFAILISQSTAKISEVKSGCGAQ